MSSIVERTKSGQAGQARQRVADVWPARLGLGKPGDCTAYKWLDVSLTAVCHSKPRLDRLTSLATGMLQVWLLATGCVGVSRFEQV